MSATLRTTYKRTARDARRVSEAFRACTKHVDGRLLRERISDVADLDLPEGPEGRHSAAYLAAITEVAAAAEREHRDDARAFAKQFVSRPAAYSRTRAGLAAIQLEAWLIENGGVLYERFVETVLDGGDSNFLAVFEGMFSDSEKDRLRVGTGGFLKFEPIAEAGAVNYDSGEILEFSMFDCAAVGKQDANVLPTNAYEPNMPGTPAQVRPTFESLLPRTRDEYDRVYEQDGVSRAVAAYLLGADRIAAAKVMEGRLLVQDVNGVYWMSETGDVWIPDVDSIDEWSGDSSPEPSVVEAATHPIYERVARTGAMRSYCGTWACFDSPVLVESDTRAATVVVARGYAWTVDRPLEEARELIERYSDLYADSPCEGDMLIEAALAEYAEEHGTPCLNESEVLQLVEGSPDRPTRADRDYDVKVVTTQRLAEALGHGGYDAQALCKVAEDALRKKAPGRFSRAYFDARFGQGGQVFIKFYNAPANASDVDKLNSKPNFTISIDPFDNEGRALSPKVKAVMLTAYPRDIGWRGKTATPDVMARYLEAFIEKLDLDTVVEADDEEDEEDDAPDPKAEKKPEEGKPANPR